MKKPVPTVGAATKLVNKFVRKTAASVPPPRTVPVTEDADAFVRRNTEEALAGSLPPRADSIVRDPIGDLIGGGHTYVGLHWPGLMDEGVTHVARRAAYHKVRAKSLVEMVEAAPLYGVDPQAVSSGSNMAFYQIMDAARQRTEAIGTMALLARMPGGDATIDEWLESSSAMLTRSEAIENLDLGIRFYERLGEHNVAMAMSRVRQGLASGAEDGSTADAAAVGFWVATLGTRVGDSSYDAVAGMPVSGLTTYVNFLVGTLLRTSDASEAWHNARTIFDNPETTDHKYAHARLSHPRTLQRAAESLRPIRPELAEQLDRFARQVAVVMDDNPSTLANHAEFVQWKMAVSDTHENLVKEVGRANGMEIPWWPWPITQALHNLPAGPLRDVIQGWRERSRYTLEPVLQAPLGFFQMFSAPIAGSGLVGQVDEEEQMRLVDKAMEESPGAAIAKWLKGEKYTLGIGEYAGPSDMESIATQAQPGEQYPENPRRLNAGNPTWELGRLLEDWFRPDYTPNERAEMLKEGIEELQKEGRYAAIFQDPSDPYTIVVQEKASEGGRPYPYAIQTIPSKTDVGRLWGAKALSKLGEGMRRDSQNAAPWVELAGQIGMTGGLGGLGLAAGKTAIGGMSRAAGMTVGAGQMAAVGPDDFPFMAALGGAGKVVRKIPVKHAAKAASATELGLLPVMLKEDSATQESQKTPAAQKIAARPSREERRSSQPPPPKGRAAKKE